jgi:dihydrofolate synthase/folylpolyglutamate synthase
VDAHAAAGEIDFVAHTGDAELELPGAPLKLLGHHQAANAALALATALELRRQGWLISTDAMRSGLAEATLPGRIEVVARRPTIVLDVAHNVASVAALVESLRESFAAGERLLVFAASRDKDAQGMLSVLLPHFQQVIVTEFQENPRAIPVEQLAQWCREELARLGRPATQDDLPSNPLHARKLPAEAWSLARELARPDQLVCITGSFFIAAELRGLVAATAAPSVPA